MGAGSLGKGITYPGFHHNFDIPALMYQGVLLQGVLFQGVLLWLNLLRVANTPEPSQGSDH